VASFQFRPSVREDELLDPSVEPSTALAKVLGRGRPAGVLIGFASEEDWFEYRLEHYPEFCKRSADPILSRDILLRRFSPRVCREGTEGERQAAM
jgi:hypothetical protein